MTNYEFVYEILKLDDSTFNALQRVGQKSTEFNDFDSSRHKVLISRGFVERTKDGVRLTRSGSLALLKAVNNSFSHPLLDTFKGDLRDLYLARGGFLKSYSLYSSRVDWFISQYVFIFKSKIILEATEEYLQDLKDTKFALELANFIVKPASIFSTSFSWENSVLFNYCLKVTGLEGEFTDLGSTGVLKYYKTISGLIPPIREANTVTGDRAKDLAFIECAREKLRNHFSKQIGE